MKFGLIGALIVTLGCAASATVPVRATVGKSGYATVLKAPPAPIAGQAARTRSMKVRISRVRSAP